MSPRRRVLLSALSTGVLLFATFAAPASAQFYDVARRSLDFSMDGIERSPRLLGMGRLTFVGDDPHIAITLWDFAANPVGIAQADSGNTVEVFPATASYSSIHDRLLGAETLERQVGAARENRMSYEIWRRTSGGSAYGFAGNLGHLRTDQIYSESMERRTTLDQPTIMPVITGRVPFARSAHWLYAARLFYSGEGSVDQYRLLVQNSMGQYIDQDGVQLNPPEFFTPTDYKVRTVGGGLGVAYDHGPGFKASVVMDQFQNNIEGTCDAPRHSSHMQEKRPYSKEQLSVVGRLGRELEWGGDVRRWRSSSEETWFFSISAGVGANPLVGRGKLLERNEFGTAFRWRLRWKRGPFELGGGLGTGYRRVAVTPPAIDDRTSFNYFRNTAYYYPNADSLVLPDSVSYNQTFEHTWEAGGGLAYRLPGRGGLWGVEFHQRQYQLKQTRSGKGPHRKGWDVRTGFEYPCTSVMSGSIGYVYRWEDQDELTLGNEYVGHSVTLGVGLRPTGASWVIQTGYAVEWRATDYGDPTKPRSGSQQLASMIRWSF